MLVDSLIDVIVLFLNGIVDVKYVGLMFVAVAVYGLVNIIKGVILNNF